MTRRDADALGTVRHGDLWSGIRAARRWAPLLLVCLLALPGWAGAQTATDPSDGATRVDLMKKAPYLIYPGDNTEMEVLWQLTATATSTIDWGVDNTYSSGSVQSDEYGTDHQHAYTISGLTPGGFYLYRVTTGGIEYDGTFRAAPSDDAENLKFVVYGDTRTNTSVHDQVAGCIIANYQADPGFQTLNIVDGDLTAAGDNEANWTSELFSPSYPHIRQSMANEPFQALMGNHESAGNLFRKYFPYPFVGGRYWSFDYGPAHFVIMDQYTAYGAGSAQLQWITTDLQNSSKPWKFICLHEPGWSADGGHEDNTTVQTYIQPLCLQYGVSIVFGGHNHYYARAVVSGVEHLTVGGGGAPLYTPNSAYPYIVATAKVYHYSRVTITGSALHYEAVAVNGSIIDTFDLQNASSVPAISETSGSILVQPNPFSAETHVSWSVPGSGPVRLQIVDVTGRLVKSFAPQGAGTVSLRWDGRNDRGERLPSGVYYGHLDMPQASRVLRLLVLN